MEFTSFQEFKDAIIDNNVLNGRGVKFVKNDAKRVRNACKEECGLSCVCKVKRSHTYRVKTLVQKRTLDEG